jgi:hypothetical protein
MNFESFRTLCESHKETPTQLIEVTKQAFNEKALAPDDFAKPGVFRGLAESLLGFGWQDVIRKRNQNPLIQEAVSLTAFNGITNQIFFTTVMDTWNTAPRILSSRVRTIPSKLSVEKIPIPGLSSSYGYDINENEPYPEDTFGRHWIETPRSAKNGKIIRLTMEAVFFDRAGFVLESARDLARQVAESIELRIAACLAGVTISLDGKSFNGNTWKWCKPNETSATAYNTYQTTATGAGINFQTGQTLADEVDVNELFLLATAMTHPDTAQPAGFASELQELIVTPWKGREARLIMGAIEVREPNSTTRMTIAKRSIPMYEVIESVHLYSALTNSGVSAANAKDYYFLTNLNKGIAYIQNNPINVEQQSIAGSDKAFENDLVWSGRVTEMGQAAVMSPWHLYGSRNS